MFELEAGNDYSNTTPVELTALTPSEHATPSVSYEPLTTDPVHSSFTSDLLPVQDARRNLQARGAIANAHVPSLLTTPLAICPREVDTNHARLCVISTNGKDHTL